jgi:type IV pilus assembly protein PilC
MQNYKYEIRNKTGQVSGGVMAAASPTAAAQMLRQQGSFVLSLTAEALQASTLKRVLAWQPQLPPSSKDVLNFTNQLAVMIKAGISIRAALEGIADQVENLKFRAILQQVKADVEGGKPFSEALAKYPKVFSPLYINMVRAAELSGALADMLERIVDYLALQIDTRSQVRGAMIYPAIIGLMAVVTTVFMLTFVLPRFVMVFAGKEHLLPLPTKIILALSSAMCNYWFLFILAIAVQVIATWWVLKTQWGIVKWDYLKLKIPVLKRLCRCMYISRSMHTMGELCNAGVPMLEALNITANIAGNTLYRDLWRQISLAVKQGKRIAETMEKSTLLPKSVVQMVACGEESGKLSEVLRDVSSFYQKELRSVIRTVTAMIEPIMIVIMGCIVGFIAMSIMLPIFKLSAVIKG